MLRSSRRCDRVRMSSSLVPCVQTTLFTETSVCASNPWIEMIMCCDGVDPFSPWTEIAVELREDTHNTDSASSALSAARSRHR